MAADEDDIEVRLKRSPEPPRDRTAVYPQPTGPPITPPPARPARRRLALVIAALTAGLLALVVAAAQLVLPGVAEQRLRDALGPGATGVEVEVSAFPAVTLLWNRADRVVVRADTIPTGNTELGDLLVRTRATGTLDARITAMRKLGVPLQDVRLTKQGDRLVGRASVTEQALREAPPLNLGITDVSSDGGDLTFTGSVTVLGRTVTAPLRLKLDRGRLVLSADVRFGRFAKLTVFGDERVRVESIAVGEDGDAYTFTATGRLAE